MSRHIRAEGRAGHVGLPPEWLPCFDALDEGLFRCDAGGTILWCNARGALLESSDHMPAEILLRGRLLLAGVRYRSFPIVRKNQLLGYMVRAQREILRESEAAERLKALGATAAQIRAYVLIHRGETAASAGRILGISPRTVEGHLSALYRIF